MKEKISNRARSWVFTWNNPTNDDQTYLMDMECRFLIFQKEKESTEHFQGTVIFPDPISFKSVKKLLPKCHLEPCVDIQSSIKYCSKEDTRIDGPWEKGIRPRQGGRTDLEEVAKMVKEGATMKQIAEELPVQVIKYHKGIEVLRSLNQLQRNWEMEVYVFHGSTGTGKTRDAVQASEEVGLFMKPAGDWWGSYDGEHTVIMDDFACDMKITELLRVLDRYPLEVPVKGGFKQFVSKRIFITSNIPYCEWYPNCRQEHRDALRRRITKIVHYNKPLGGSKVFELPHLDAVFDGDDNVR